MHPSTLAGWLLLAASGILWLLPHAASQAPSSPPANPKAYTAPAEARPGYAGDASCISCHRTESISARNQPSVAISSAFPFTTVYEFGYQGIPTVSDVQAYLDLAARGGRDQKQADYLFDNAIEPTWKAA